MMKTDTVATIKLITDIDKLFVPGFMELVFSRGMWLKPTFEL
jgi:hypothetical protein